MAPRVAIVEFDGEVAESFSQGLRLIGGIDDLNEAGRSVVVKVGVFNHKADNHTSVSLVDAIINSFDKAPRIFLAESDNYQGTGSERLQIWKELFSERVVPFNLSDDSDSRRVRLADEDMSLSHVLFKPNILVDTHILRKYERGSILKNLFGCIPTRKKVKYHKILPSLLADIYEAVGGVDLAVLDGTCFRGKTSGEPVRMNTVLLGRDAVAVETVGAILAGLNPEKMPIIQEFVKRGLGEGDMKNIEIVGASVKGIEEKFASEAKSRRKLGPQSVGPQTWGGQVHRAIKSLVQEGFFKLPTKRTREDVARALESRTIPTKGKEHRIAEILANRVKRGVLKAAKDRDGWLYWTE